MKPQQCRAARAYLGWSQETLAEKSGVAVSTLRNFERGATVPVRNNLQALRRALETAGVVFAEDGSVILK